MSGVIIGLFIAGVIIYAMNKQANSPAGIAAREAHQAQQAQIVCAFCQQAGGVTARQVKRAKRKTATRIVGGIATAGGSLALTGVSKKGTVTELYCGRCGMSWDAPQVTF